MARYRPRPLLSLLERRLLLSAVFWDGGAETMNWSDAANWSGDQLPAPVDDVTVDLGIAAVVSVSANDAVHVHSLQSSSGFFVTGSLLVDSHSELYRLEINGGTFGGAGDIRVASNQTTAFNNGTLIGPGTISFSGALSVSTSPGGGQRVIDGSTVSTPQLSIRRGLTVRNSVGHEPTIIIPAGGFLEWRTAEGITSDSTSMLVLDDRGTLSVPISQSSGVLDLTSVKIVGAIQKTVISSETQLNATHLGDLTLSNAAGLTVIGSMDFGTATGNTFTGDGGLALVGGTHTFGAGSIAPGGNPYTSVGIKDGSAELTAPFSPYSLVLNNATLNGTVAFSPTYLNLNTSVWDYQGPFTSFQTYVSGPEQVLLKRPLVATSEVVVEGDTTLVAGDDLTGPVDVVAGLLRLYPNSRIVGNSRSRVIAGRTTILATTTDRRPARIEIGIDSQKYDVPAFGELQLAGAVAQLNDGIATGEWSLTGGTILLEQAGPITVNRGIIKLDTAASRFPAIATLARNEGQLIVRQSATLDLPSFTNAASGILQLGTNDTTKLAPILRVNGDLTLDGALKVECTLASYYGADDPTLMTFDQSIGTFATTSLLPTSNVVGTARLYPTSLTFDLFARAPATPQLKVGSDSGRSTDNITNVSKPTFIVTSNDAGILQLLVDGKIVGKQTVTTITPTTWEFTLNDALSDGTHNFSARTIDLQDTPGRDSFFRTVTIDTIAPALAFSSNNQDKNWATTLQFSEPLAATGAIELRNLSDNTLGAAPAVTSTQTGLVTVTPVGTLKDGYWRLRLPAGGTLTDIAGNALLTNVDVNFAVLACDVDRSGVVDFGDLVILSQNYGLSGRTYSQGNFNRSTDGLVNLSDLTLLAQRYGRTLGAPPTGASTVPAKKTTRNATKDELLN